MWDWWYGCTRHHTPLYIIVTPADTGNTQSPIVLRLSNIMMTRLSTRINGFLNCCQNFTGSNSIHLCLLILVFYSQQTVPFNSWTLKDVFRNLLHLPLPPTSSAYKSPNHNKILLTRSDNILVNLSGSEYWRFHFSELWEVVAQNLCFVQLGFCHIWAQTNQL